MPPQAFVSMCRTLRVLNAVRDYMVGVPLTYGQYPFAFQQCLSHFSSRFVALFLFHAARSAFQTAKTRRIRKSLACCS